MTHTLTSEAPGLTADGAACDWEVENAVLGAATACGRLSRYRVERSDGDASFYPEPDRRPGMEACDIHLGDTVVALMDGQDEIAAIVRVRWDA